MATDTRIGLTLFPDLSVRARDIVVPRSVPLSESHLVFGSTRALKVLRPGLAADQRQSPHSPQGCKCPSSVGHTTHRPANLLNSPPASSGSTGFSPRLVPPTWTSAPGNSVSTFSLTPDSSAAISPRSSARLWSGCRPSVSDDRPT